MSVTALAPATTGKTALSVSPQSRLSYPPGFIALERNLKYSFCSREREVKDLLLLVVEIERHSSRRTESGLRV